VLHGAKVELSHSAVRTVADALQDGSRDLLITRARIYIFLTFCLLILFGSATIYLAVRAGEADQWVAHTLEVGGTATSLLNSVDDGLLAMRGYLLTGESRELELANKAMTDPASARSDLRRLTLDDPTQQAALDELETVLNGALEYVRKALTFAQEGRRAEALDMVKSGLGADLMKQINAKIHAVQEREGVLLRERESTSAALRIWLLVLIFCSLAGAIVLAGLLWREVQAGLARLRERTAQLESEVKLRRGTEDKLRQSQKLEVVGQLTGGIAHDFNNFLTVILGNLDTLRRRLSNPSSGQPAEEFLAALLKPVDAALQGARSAAQLTHRLLAFARQQPLEPARLDLNQLVPGIAEMLRRTLGETISLECILGGGVWPTFADANQLESALVNLCVNSRDAMPDGGKLTIETSNAYLDEAYAAPFEGVAPGQYASLSVTDTGIGIAAEALEHIFEPFFTTKAGGKGSGLGLAMVYGFVKQSGGHIRVYSEEGHGTTVRIYLPRLIHAEEMRAAPSARPAGSTPVSRAARQETLLIVEDNQKVREYARSALEELGYSVIEAGSTEEALRVLERPLQIDLLFTDVVLPDANGRELSEMALNLRPNLAVLFTTGYTRNAIIHQQRLDADVKFLNKPYTQRELAIKIRDALDSGAPQPAPGC
jgi:signal transduction histidine kinase/ActR/RegA family two-component response regulator